MLQRLRITLRPRLKAHQLRADDSPKDLIDFHPGMSYSGEHTVVLRVVDVLSGDGGRGGAEGHGECEKTPLNEGAVPVVTVLSDMSQSNSAKETEANEKRF